MSQLLGDILSIFCVLWGVFFMFVGVVGIVRLPDCYHRLHAGTKCVTLGLTGLLLAVLFHMQTLDVLMKMLLVIVFMFAANPVGSHMLAKAALHDRARQWDGTLDDEREQDRT